MNSRFNTFCRRMVLAFAAIILLVHCGESSAEKANRLGRESARESEDELNRLGRESAGGSEGESKKQANDREVIEAKVRAEEAARRAKNESETAARVAAEESRTAADKAAKLAKEQAQEMEKARKTQDHENKLAESKATFAEKAEAQFGKIRLDPQVEFSAELKARGASVELRGPLLAKLRALIAAKDWMGLLTELGTGSIDRATGVPRDDQLREGVKRLSDKPIPMVVKVPALPEDASSGNGYHLLSLRTFDAVDISEPHPDGGAYVVQWRASMGDCIIVKGRIPTDGMKLWGGNIWITALDKEKERLEKKKELGEVDETAIVKALEEKRAAISTQVRQWAGVATNGDANPLQEAATAFTQKQWPRLAALLRAEAAKPGADPAIGQAAALIESVVADLKEIEAIPARIKAANDEYARLNLETVKPQPEAQREALSKKALQVRDSVSDLPIHSTKLRLKATESVREAEALLRKLVAF